MRRRPPLSVASTPVRVVSAFAACMTVLLAAVLPAHAQQNTPPDVLQHVPSTTTEVIVVQHGSAPSHGTVSAWQYLGSQWVQVVAATPARLGANGVVAEALRRQGSNTTPAGTFTITSTFGRRANPGTAMPYIHLTHADAWTYNPADPATYNLFQSAHVPWNGYRDDVEHLRAKGLQYDYVAVIDYNVPPGPITVGSDGIRRSATPANTQAGGGIFLHVDNGHATEGCVSVAEPVMQHLLRWLTPTAQPLIIIS
jgi:L,D-peptidoglycan transpeptidase YkuD (ErfK/YbiS/YcfS/YnhG family)